MIVNVFLAVVGAAFVGDGCRRFERSKSLAVYMVATGLVGILTAVIYRP